MGFRRHTPLRPTSGEQELPAGCPLRVTSAARRSRCRVGGPSAERSSSGHCSRSCSWISHHQVRDGYLIERAGPVVSWLIRNTALGFGIASKRRQIQRRLGLKPEPTPAADVASAATHLESLAARATAAGVPIGFVVLPDRHQLVSSTRKGTPASQPPTSALKLDLDRRLELARPHLEATGGPVLDGTPDLPASTSARSTFPETLT